MANGPVPAAREPKPIWDKDMSSGKAKLTIPLSATRSTSAKIVKRTTPRDVSSSARQYGRRNVTSADDEDRALVLKFRHVYAGKGGWYGYKSGHYGPINSRSQPTPRLYLEKYRKDVLKKMSRYIQRTGMKNFFIYLKR